MVDYKKKRKYLAKRASISAIITSIITLSVLSVLIRFYWIGPRCTTNFFHFNLDYRLGNERVEETIIKEPYHKLLLMYDKHPNWKFTIECQAEMIKKIYENSSYSDIAALTDKLVNRGQMELICGLQFSQLFHTYPADVLELNLKYANETLNAHGLLDKRSRCLIFQEGQYGYGLATGLNSQYAANIDTVLVSYQEIYDFQDYDYLGGDSPLWELTNSETGKSLYLLVYDYLPKWEAGYMHSWNFLSDAELGFESDDDNLPEFSVDQRKLDEYEQQLLLLESEGNKFMTCEEWVGHCIEVDAIKELDYYIPECHWGTTKYNSSYIWAANNGDSTDDGEMLANNYRCRQIILATRKIYETYKNNVSSANQTIIENKFRMAERLWLQATVTDATGIGPDAIERLTAEENVYIAEKNCSQIIEIISYNVSAVDVQKLQVDLKTGNIYNNTSDFISLITYIGALTVDDLPIRLNTYTQGGSAPLISVSNVSYNSADSAINNETFNLFELDVTFNGTHDWKDRSIKKIGIQFRLYGRSVKEIVYCPSLLENIAHKRLWRYNYQYDPVYIFLPLSNGLIFLPDEYTGFRGTAIIKNVTQRHTSWLWEYSYLEVLEDEGLCMDAHHQFFIIDDISLEEAIRLANRINVSPPWIVSENVNFTQGHEVYDMYLNMANRLSDVGEGSGEWW